jgi:hypothetical protein
LLTDCQYYLTHLYVLGTAAKSDHMVLHPNSPLALRPVLYSGHLSVARPWELWKVNDEDERDLKHNDRTQHGLLAENQKMLIHLFISRT